MVESFDQKFKSSLDDSIASYASLLEQLNPYANVTIGTYTSNFSPSSYVSGRLQLPVDNITPSIAISVAEYTLLNTGISLPANFNNITGNALPNIKLAMITPSMNTMGNYPPYYVITPQIWKILREDFGKAYTLSETIVNFKLKLSEFDKFDGYTGVQKQFVIILTGPYNA
jgi:hypothetical protein